jgi:hypothetical protein
VGHPRLRPYRRCLRHEPPTEGDWATIESLGRFGIAPLVCKEPRLVASVEIVMLRPEPEGRIFVRSDDIDNRPKTLLDALNNPLVGVSPRRLAPAEHHGIDGRNIRVFLVGSRPCSHPHLAKLPSQYVLPVAGAVH